MMNEYYANEPMDQLKRRPRPQPRPRPSQARCPARPEPNVWFNNVELMASEKIGRETVTYVSNGRRAGRLSTATG
jgi:hypothetical protein